MKLITFGDSWVWGDDLKSKECEYRSNVNIGGLINKDYEFESYINYANNGASNERIILQLMEYKNSKYYNENDFLVIGLSSLQRTLLYLYEIYTPFTIPNWDHKTHVEEDLFQKDGLSEIKTAFESYMKGVLRFEVNDRNELIRYNINLNALKSLLSSHKKYIVFQSIDNPKKMFDTIYNDKKDWNEIVLHHDYEGIRYDNESTIFFDKENLIKELSSNLLDTQKWINLTEDSWINYLDLNYKNYSGEDHPTESQIEYWYRNVLKKYTNMMGLNKKQNLI